MFSVKEKFPLKIYFLEKHQIGILSSRHKYEVVIVQWLARRFATGEGLGSNTGKGENLLISD